MIIKVDDREPLSMLKRLDRLKIGYERVRMVTGDYVCGDVCIERKTIDDMCGSIVDGRLVTQVERMKNTFGYNYVVVVGRIADKVSNIHPNCLLGKITSLVIKDNVKVLMCDNEEQFCYLLKSIIEKTNSIISGM